MRVLKSSLYKTDNLREDTKHFEYLEKNTLIKQASSFSELKSVIVSLTTSPLSVIVSLTISPLSQTLLS